MNNKKKYRLLKDLPNCPKGYIFKQDIGGDYYLSATDEEFINNDLKIYKFTKEEVENNKDWFEYIDYLKVETITESDFLEAVANQKIELIEYYLEPTGVTIKELMDREAFSSLCQLLDAYLLEAVRNNR